VTSLTVEERPPAETGPSAPAPETSAPRGNFRRILEEEFIVIALLAGFALICLLIFPPSMLINDTWLNLVAGREVWENGLPSRDELTVYGLGSTWTDQQWLAQLGFFGLHALGGHALLAVGTAAVVVSAFALAAAGARWLGAGQRSIWVVFLPVLLAAPWAWASRAQVLVLPLFTGLLWLLASQARRPTRWVWLALPMLVVWANVHGSVTLAALLVMLLGAYELVRSRGRSGMRSVLLLALPPLAILATPYGPITTARYYHRMLVDPPFAGHVTEWAWAKPAVITLFFYVLALIALPLVVWGRRRLTVFDFAVLALTFVGGVTAIRGIVWFALACMLYVPVAIGVRLESRNPAPIRRRFNAALSVALIASVVVVTGISLARDGSWYEKLWPSEPVEAVRAELRPEDRAFISDRFSNWMLWMIPELRGRIAYDVRFELYDHEFFDRLEDYAAETGAEWMSFADGYRIVVVDETRRSHTADFLAEPGARAIYRSDEMTIIARVGTSSG
jgi:hypothetical protein